MKWFISQPMNGKTDEEIKEEREKIAKGILKEHPEDEIIDSFFEKAPHEEKPLWFLGKSLELMSQADIIFFAKGWENARGCVIENKCANDYGYVVIEEYR